ncbi:MAG: hypothetical protein ACUVWV_08500 [Thermodesulfobacteriota bacterium]
MSFPVSKYARQSRGTSTFGCLLFLILATILIYGGLKFGSAIWTYFEVKYKIQEALNWAVAGSAKSDMEITQKIIANVAETGVELKPRHISIKHTTDDLIIAVSWQQYIAFPYFSFPLNFKVTITGEKRWLKGPLILK